MTQLSPQPAPAKITPRIFGGLGNQLFCYAAARRLALVNNAELVLDDVSGFTYDDFYQRHYQLDHFSIPCRKATPAERLEPYHRVRRYLKRRWNQRKPFAQRAYLVHKPASTTIRACCTSSRRARCIWKAIGKAKIILKMWRIPSARTFGLSPHRCSQPGHGRTVTQLHGGGGAWVLF
jgi:hypothetical protein